MALDMSITKQFGRHYGLDGICVSGFHYIEIEPPTTDKQGRLYQEIMLVADDYDPVDDFPVTQNVYPDSIDADISTFKVNVKKHMEFLSGGEMGLPEDVTVPEGTSTAFAYAEKPDTFLPVGVVAYDTSRSRAIMKLYGKDHEPGDTAEETAAKTKQFNRTQARYALPMPTSIFGMEVIRRILALRR